MISIKKYLYSESAFSSESNTALLYLAEGLGSRLIEGDPSDLERFQEQLELAVSGLRDGSSSVPHCVIAQGVLRALEEYNRRTSKMIRVQSAELQTMVGMLSQTIVNIGAASERTSTHLQDIEKQIERASAVNDLRTLKQRLAECLENVRAEVKRQKAESSSSIAGLQGELARSQERVKIARREAEIDPLTGLPDRGTAEVVLDELGAQPDDSFVVTIVVDRLELIVGRFGMEAHDQAILAVNELIAASLQKADRVFRWSDAALLALVRRPGRLDQVRQEISQIASVRTDVPVRMGTRIIRLPVGITWAIFPMSASARFMSHKIDAFIVSQAQIR
jgi:GGDEF domain-containing protein